MLQSQNSYSLLHLAYHTFKRRRVYIHSVDDQWQADLVDMQQYKSENNNLTMFLQSSMVLVNMLGVFL